MRCMLQSFLDSPLRFLRLAIQNNRSISLSDVDNCPVSEIWARRRLFFVFLGCRGCHVGKCGFSQQPHGPKMRRFLYLWSGLIVLCALVVGRVVGLSAGVAGQQIYRIGPSEAG